MQTTPLLFGEDLGPDYPLTAHEVARELGVATSTVCRWTELGHMRALRRMPGRNGRILYTRAELDRVKALFRDGLRFAGSNARGRAS